MDDEASSQTSSLKLSRHIPSLFSFTEEEAFIQIYLKLAHLKFSLESKVSQVLLTIFNTLIVLCDGLIIGFHEHFFLIDF